MEMFLHPIVVAVHNRVAKWSDLKGDENRDAIARRAFMASEHYDYTM